MIVDVYHGSHKKSALQPEFLRTLDRAEIANPYNHGIDYAAHSDTYRIDGNTARRSGGASRPSAFPSLSDG
jgi:hypothetical protein